MGIALLGPLAIDGVTGGLRPHDRVVLSALAVRPGEEVSADRLAGALWRDDPPDTWAKVVQGCVVRLRRALGAGTIETRPHGYRLVLPPDDIDTVRFERLVGRARELLARAEPERAAYLLDEAVALWRGPAYADLEGWDPAQAEIARLGELLRDAEELGVDAALRAGRSREVLGRAQTLVAEEPLRERRWGLLALGQYQAGQQAEALRTLRELRSVLADELGLDPAPELVALERSILRQDPALVAAAALPEPSPVCPYPGLVPYGVGDGDTFFGRDEEVAECLRRLARDGTLAVAGPSGSGKSSLVRAGIASALQRAGRPVCVVTPGAHPVDALSVLPGTGPCPVLVVDQCEEVFTLGGDPAERDEFFRRLSEHARRGPLVTALRADRIGEISAYPSFSRLVEQGLFLLGPMGPDKLRACIEGPARQAALLLEPGLVDLLVREVEGEPGALPLLSHALRETWAHREGRTLTVDGYRATGGIRGAVARSAEEVYAQVGPDQRRIVRDLLLRLVAPSVEGSPVRSRMPRRLVSDDQVHAEVIERLVGARLLISDDGVLELAHEALVRAWPRFREWLDDDAEGQRILRHLSLAADTWDTMGRPDSELYRGTRLAQALHWWQTARPGLTPVERAFLGASEALDKAELREARERAETERQARQRTRRLAVGLAAALALALVAAGGATWFQQAASDRAAEAARASTESDANRLAALSRSVKSLDLSLLLAAQAFRTADTPATRDGLLRTLVAHRRAVRVVPTQQPPTDVQAAEGGRSLFISRPLRIDVWHRGSAGPPATIAHWGHKNDFIAASSAGDLVASWTWKDDDTPEVSVLDSRGHQRLDLVGFDRIGGWPSSLGLSADGRRLFLAVLRGQDGGVRRMTVDEYDVATGDRVRSTPVLRTGAPGAWPAAHIDDAATTEVSWVGGRRGRPATLLDLGNGRRHRIRTDERSVASLGYFALPTGAAQRWADGAVTLYDRTGRPRQVLQAHRDAVTDIVVSPTGTWAASSDDSGQVVVWNIDPDSGEWSPREALAGHDGHISSLAVDQQGRTLFSAAADGTTVVWDMTRGGGFGAATGGLGDSWISNTPAEVVPGKVVVAPTRPAPSWLGGWGDQRDVSATFLDPRTGRVLDRVPIGENEGFIFGSSVSVSPDRSMVAVTYGYGTVVLDARTHRVLRRIVLPKIEMFGERHPEQVWCTAWTPDGRRLLVCADGHQFDPTDGNLVVVDTDTWRIEPDRVDVGGAVQSLELSHDGRLLAAGMTMPDVDHPPPGAVRLLDAHSLRVVRELRLGPDDFPYDLSFSPDGTRLAVGVASGEVYAFDVATGRRLHGPIRVHNEFVQQVEWLPDGRTVATTSPDGLVTLYDVERGLVRASLPASTDGGLAYTYLVSVSADHLTALSGDRPGRSYDLDARRWLDYACGIVRRDLTRDEWSRYLPGRPYQHTCSDRS